MEQTGAGTTLGITEVTGEVGMTLGITADTGAGMTLGIIHITDGTIHIGATTITTTDRDMVLTVPDTETYGTVQGHRPVQTAYTEAIHRYVEVAAAEAP